MIGLLASEFMGKMVSYCFNLIYLYSNYFWGSSIVLSCPFPMLYFIVLYFLGVGQVSLLNWLVKTLTIRDIIDFLFIIYCENMFSSLSCGFSFLYSFKMYKYFKKLLSYFLSFWLGKGFSIQNHINLFLPNW